MNINCTYKSDLPTKIKANLLQGGGGGRRRWDLRDLDRTQDMHPGVVHDVTNTHPCSTQSCLAWSLCRGRPWRTEADVGWLLVWALQREQVLTIDVTDVDRCPFLTHQHKFRSTRSTALPRKAPAAHRPHFRSTLGLADTWRLRGGLRQSSCTWRHRRGRECLDSRVR